MMLRFAAAALLFTVSAQRAEAADPQGLREAENRAEENSGERPAAGGIIRFGEDVLVEAGEEVNGPVVVARGSIQVNGRVNGPVIAFGGSTRLGPNSFVNGPAMSVGGRTTRAAGSRVNGPIIDTPGAAFLARIAALAAYLGAAAGVAYIIAKASASVGWIVLGLVLIALFPKQMRITKDCLERRFTECGLAGLAAWPCLLVISMTLLLSIIGMPLIPLIFALAAAAYVWGFSALGFLIGERLAHGRWKHQLASMVVGMILLKLLQWVPIVHWAVSAVVALVGVGASVLSRFGIAET